MQPLGYIPAFESKEVLAEIDIRGRFMMMACDIEWSMLNIMIYSAADPHNHHRANKFEGMMMHEKIQNTICDLKTHHPAYYKEYQGSLAQLMEFKLIRNDMGHYRLEFTDDTLLNFKMPYIGELNGEERVLWKHYNIPQVLNLISKFRKANMELANLVLKLKADYDAKIGQRS